MKKNYKLKIICMLCVSIVALGSCKKNEVVEEKGLTNRHVTKAEAADGAWDVLGYGYDATGEALMTTSISDAPIIDMKRFEQDYRARLNVSGSTNMEPKLTSGANAVEYVKDINRNFGIGIKVGDTTKKSFSGSLNASKGSQTSNTYLAKYSYANYESFKVVKQIRFTQDATVELLRNYLTPEFQANLQNLDAATLVNRYGTHILLDISIGGRMQVKHSSSVIKQNESSQKKRGIKLSLGFFLKKIGINLNVDGSTEEINKSMTENRERSYDARFYGGETTGTSISIDADGNVSGNYNYAAWEASVNDRNSALVFINRTIYLSELISDPIKSGEVKSYIDQYIADSQVRMSALYTTTDLYRMFNVKDNDRLITVSPGEVASNGDWRNEGSIGRIYTNNLKPGTVPLYRVQLFNGKHLFTLNWSEAHNGYYEGVTGYVNSTQEIDDLPIYRYRNNKVPHLYTRSFDEFGWGRDGWILEGNIGFLPQ
jgi:hypothetical protein